MASNPFSSLNPTKTELIWLSSSRRINLLSTSPIRLFGTAIRPSQSIRDLGVIVDSDLSLSAHVSHITSVCFYYLRQLLVRWSLTMDAAHSLVRAMIHSRLDSCNSLLAGLPTGQMSRLLSVLRAATRLVLGLPGRAPVSAAMRDTLHWLSFPQRVTFKLCLLTYKCLHGLALNYLSHFYMLLTSVPGRPLLRWADANKLLVPQSCMTSFGPRSFGSSGLTAWNDMPAHLCNFDLILRDFRQLLKTAVPV